MTAPNLKRIQRRAINPALRLLPSEMDSPDARVLLLAIGLQESGFTTRTQADGGPARGYWQFEQGSKESLGGVWGVYEHSAACGPLEYVCKRRHVVFYPVDIYNALTTDDVLAAALARLLMYTDAYPLPTCDDPAGGWEMYAVRTWRPGKPRPDVWPANFEQGNAIVFPYD